MQDIYAMYGKLSEIHELQMEAFHREQVEHRRTVDLLREVVEGRLDADRVLLDGYDWEIAPEKPSLLRVEP